MLGHRVSLQNSSPVVVTGLYCTLIGRKVMTNLDSILKNRDVTLSTKIHLVKAVIFPVVMLKLKLQYFGHLIRRADSSEKTLMLGKTEGRRRRGR